MMNLSSIRVRFCFIFLSKIGLILAKKIMLTHKIVLDIYEKCYIFREVNEPFLERSLSGNLLKVQYIIYITKLKRFRINERQLKDRKNNPKESMLHSPVPSIVQNLYDVRLSRNHYSSCKCISNEIHLSKND